MIEIFNEDVSTIPLDFWASVDTLICDPPYSRHVHESAMSCNATNGVSLGVTERDLGFGHLTLALRRYLARAAASVRGWSLIYSDVESSWLWRVSCEAAGAEYVRTIPWVRWSQPQLSGDRPPTGCEFITICHAQEIGKRGGRKPRKKVWNGRGNMTHLEHADVDGADDGPAVLLHAALRGEDKYKAEKPLDQALELVSAFSSPGGTVCDPTCGVGTTGLACRLLGRNFVGFEILPEVCDIATARVAGPLSGRDEDRIARWCSDTQAEANAMLDAKWATPKGKARAQRRLTDVAHVEREAA